jgi:tRNA pseudouridine38-40 synthase
MDQTSPSTAIPDNTADSKASANNAESGKAGRGNDSHQLLKSEHRSNQGHSQPVKRKNQKDSRNGEKRHKQSGRQWGGQTRRERNIDSRPEAEEVEKEERRPKKKVACFIGYSGEGYHGMQLYATLQTQLIYLVILL